MNKNLYYILFFVYVVLDVFTTIYLLVNTNCIDRNPFINFLIDNSNTGIFYLLFLLIKVISLDIIVYIIDYSTKIHRYNFYILYMIVFIISAYIALNNIFLICDKQLYML